MSLSVCFNDIRADRSILAALALLFLRTIAISQHYGHTTICGHSPFPEKRAIVRQIPDGKAPIIAKSALPLFCEAESDPVILPQRHKCLCNVDPQCSSSLKFHVSFPGIPNRSRLDGLQTVRPHIDPNSMPLTSLKSELSVCLSDFKTNLDRITNSPATGASIDSLKLESVRLEGRIRNLIDNLRCVIHQDGQILPSERDSHISAVLSDLSINPDDLSSLRRAAVNAASLAAKEHRSRSSQSARGRLLGAESSREVTRTINLRAKSTSALAAEITARLAQTRDLIRGQVEESQRSIELMCESTAELNSVNDAADRVESAQKRAKWWLAVLRVAQNYDRWLLKSSLWFFGIVVAYVVFRGILRSLPVVLVRVVSKGAWSGMKWALSRKGDGQAQITDLTPSPTVGVDVSQSLMIEVRTLNAAEWQKPSATDLLLSSTIEPRPPPATDVINDEGDL
jgi:hypothetical protein